MNDVLSQEELEEQLRKALEIWSRPSLERLYREAQEGDVPDLKIPEMPSLPLPLTPKKRELDVQKRKDWGFDYGEAAKFAVAGKAWYELRGSKAEASVEAQGDLDAWILSNKQSLLHAGAGFRTPGTGEASGHALVRLMGRDVFRREFTGLKIEYGDTYRYPVDYSYDYRFAIGPVPCKAQVGARGEVGLNLYAGITVLSAAAHVSPFARADAYAQLGADIGVAGAGAGGQLLLLREQLLLQGSTALAFVNDEPAIDLELTGTNVMEALSGRLYGYAFVWIPKPWPPWKQKISFEHDLFSWKGFQSTGNIMNYQARVTSNGIIAHGDLTPEDVAHVEAINRDVAITKLETRTGADEDRLFAAIQQDLASQGERSYQVAVGEIDRVDGLLGAAMDELEAEVAH